MLINMIFYSPDTAWHPAMKLGQIIVRVQISKCALKKSESSFKKIYFLCAIRCHFYFQWYAN